MDNGLRLYEEDSCLEESKESVNSFRVGAFFAILLFVFVLNASFVSALTTVTTTPMGGMNNGGFELGTGSATSPNWIGDKNFGWYNSNLI